MSDPSFPPGDSPNYGESSKDQQQSNTDTLLLQPNASLIYGSSAGNQTKQYPFDAQVSALTEDDSNHNKNHPFCKSNQDTIPSGNKKQPPQESTMASQLFEETPIVQNCSVDTQSTGSYGFVKDHVGMTLPDLREEYDSSPLTGTEKSAEPFQNEKLVYTFPSPSQSPSPSAVDSWDNPCPPSPGGVNLGPRGSTLNVHPQSLIGSKVKLEHADELPRLVQRNRAFYQSSNKVHIKHNQGARILKLLRFNWFHVFLRWPTKWSLFMLLSLWTLSILFFALLYVAHDNIEPSQSCGLGAANDPMEFAGAFAFSLQTCTTVGYTLPNGVNSFFEPYCYGLQIIIYFQMVWSMLFNAFLMTFLYNRLGRSENRGTQVIFSRQALISIVDGEIRFQVRVFDCDAKHPVVEAHVRLYCVMKHRPVPRPLRLLQPDDDLGGKLFLSFPTVVSHNIDMYSLLHPPQATILMKPRGLVLRQVDGDTANRNDVICPVCGQSYGNFERWSSHVKYQQIAEAHTEYSIEGTHQGLDVAELEAQPGTTKPITDFEQLKDHFKQNVSEILCLVEGIDPMMSGTFQALQSYKFEDIVWEPHSQFSPCLSVLKMHMPTIAVDETFSVDLDRYHDIIPDQEAAMEEAATPVDAIRMEKPTLTNAPPKTRPYHNKTMSIRISDSLFVPIRKVGLHDNNAKAAENLSKGDIVTVLLG
jgi:Inward rectifier potassium channel transmembrane domain/Inward rectifier potassium channel C-terminal domain